MSLTPILRTRLFAAGGALIAIWLGFAVAEGSYLWPGIIATTVALFLLAWWQPLPLSTLLLAVLTVGYVVGNRGFAQLMVNSRFPLLPAEAVLLVAGPLLLIQCAWRHELPFRRDPLNLLLLAWMTLGTVRVIFDVRVFGFLALRDFAMVYYTVFFYLAQDAVRQAGAARTLENVLLASSIVLLPVHLLFEQFPDFFLGTLTVRGTPLIFYKGDLVGTFLAVGSVLSFLRFEENGRRSYVGLSLALAGAVLATNNRASMLGLLAAALCLAIGRRWRFSLLLGGSGLAAAVIISLAAALTHTPWERTPLFSVYERIVSLADPTGKRVYSGGETFNKGDNNLFRTVWWQAVIDETLDGNPYLGLGFGRDLADRFVRLYYPENSEEFSTRSPHNFLLTVFARMGAAGLAVLLAAMTVIAVRTKRAIRRDCREAASWCSIWVMFTSACLGVVLEGPMGAVVFWTLLGVAHGTSREREAGSEGAKNLEAVPLPTPIPAE